MKVHHTLICFFFLSLQDGNPEVTSAGFLYYGVTGEDVTVRHAFQSSGTWKIFCKEECEGEHILINTTDVRGQRGRYSTEFKKESTYYILSVSISQLTESDSGQYRCGLGGSSSSPSYVQFGIFVSEALLDGNDDDPSQQKHFYKEPGSSLTVGCSFKDSGSRKLFCRGECGGDNTLIQTNDVRAQRDRYIIGYRRSLKEVILYVSITHLSKSDSGRYRCSLDQTSSRSFRDFEITVTDDVSLYVGLPLAVTIILLSVAVLIFCKKRSSKPKDPLVEMEDSAITEGEDDSRTVMSFSNKSFGFPNSSSHSNTNEVIYSVTQNVHYENCTPVSTCEDSIYQKLDPASRDLDQTYSTLTHHT